MRTPTKAVLIELIATAYRLLPLETNPDATPEEMAQAVAEGISLSQQPIEEVAKLRRRAEDAEHELDEVKKVLARREDRNTELKKQLKEAQDALAAAPKDPPKLIGDLHKQLADTELDLATERQQHENETGHYLDQISQLEDRISELTDGNAAWIQSLQEQHEAQIADYESANAELARDNSDLDREAYRYRTDLEIVVQREARILEENRVLTTEREDAYAALEQMRAYMDSGMIAWVRASDGTAIYPTADGLYAFLPEPFIDWAYRRLVADSQPSYSFEEEKPRFHLFKPATWRS